MKADNFYPDRWGVGMRTVVVTGGTDGLGKGLALHYLRRGARVVAVGSTPAKGEALLAEAGPAADRAVFLRADLTSVAAARRLATRIAADHGPVDALILCAQRYRLTGPRALTPEGFEHSFALSYLSRYVLGHGLRTSLEASPRPVVLNVATPGVPLGRIHWDDLQLTRSYSGTRAVLQSFRANDLLGVSFAELYGRSGPVRYVTYNPGVVATGMPDHLPGVLRTLAKASFKVLATPVDRALPPMTGLVDDPPAEPFTAFRGDRRIRTDRPAFDRDAALRLHCLTRDLLETVPGARG